MMTLQYLLGVVVVEDHEIEQMDVKLTFLQGAYRRTCGGQRPGARTNVSHTRGVETGRQETGNQE